MKPHHVGMHSFWIHGMAANSALHGNGRIGDWLRQQWFRLRLTVLAPLFGMLLVFAWVAEIVHYYFGDAGKLMDEPLIYGDCVSCTSNVAWV